MLGGSHQFFRSTAIAQTLQFAEAYVQMSKKNNQGTRRKQHSFDLAKEAEARKKSEKKSKAAAQKLAVKPQAVKPKKKTKGVRIKKNVVVAVRSLPPSFPLSAPIPAWQCQETHAHSMIIYLPSRARSNPRFEATDRPPEAAV